MKALYPASIALALSLVACSVEHWQGGGRRQELPTDDRAQEAAGGAPTDDGSGGVAGAPADESAGAGRGGTAGLGGGGSAGAPFGLGAAGTAGLP